MWAIICGSLIWSHDQCVCFLSLLCCSYYYTMLLQLELGNSETCRSSSSVQDCFRYLGLFHLFVCLFSHMKLKNDLSSSVRNYVVIFMEISLNLWTILIWWAFYYVNPIHPWALKIDLSISWSLLQFLLSMTWGLYHISLSFAWFTLPSRYQISSAAIMKGVASLNFSSVYLPFVYKKATDLYSF